MRRIDELIWHCTATPAGREVTAKEIDAWHKARGFGRIGYHKVVHLDGSVTEGRPESVPGAHVAGRNRYTIGYAYVGGVDADNPKKARDTRTPAQKQTMERLTREAIDRYGLKKVSGHRDYAAKACPCFDARKEYGPLLRERAGQGKDPSSLARSRTVRGAGLAGGGAVGFMSQAGGSLSEAADYVSYGTIFGLGAAALVLIGLAIVLYARWDDAGRPVPWKRDDD